MQSTKLAKKVYRFSGWVSKIKTYQRYYEMANTEEWLASDEPIEFKTAGWHWTSMGLTWKLLKLAVRLDPDHFDHWALQHTDHCQATYCDHCQGLICNLPEED